MEEDIENFCRTTATFAKFSIYTPETNKLLTFTARQHSKECNIYPICRWHVCLSVRLSVTD